MTTTKNFDDFVREMFHLQSEEEITGDQYDKARRAIAQVIGTYYDMTNDEQVKEARMTLANVIGIDYDPTNDEQGKEACYLAVIAELLQEKSDLEWAVGVITDHYEEEIQKLYDQIPEYYEYEYQRY